MQTYTKVLVLPAALLLLLLMLRCLFIPHAEQALLDAHTWLIKHPISGFLTFSGVFVLWFMALVPSTALELLAGYVFGFWKGFLVLSIVKPIAHIATFLFARYVGLLDVGRAVRGHSQIFKAAGMAIADKTQTGRVLFLVQVAYFPGGIKDVGLAMIPAVQLPLFAACAAAGSVPYSFLNSYIGSCAGNLKALLRGEDTGTVGAQNAQLLLALGGGLALVVSLVLIAWQTRKALDRLLDQQRGEGEAMDSLEDKV